MRRAYPDHAYDPAPPRSWWAATVPEANKVGAPLEQDLVVDFAVVGGGFTGLNAALALAERGEDVALFDAAWPGWGASGRNGGFVCVGGTGLDYGEQIAKFGFQETQKFVGHQRASIDHVADLLTRFGIDADRHSDGEWALAHSPKAFARGEVGADVERHLGLTVNSFSQGALDERGMSGPTFHGGHQLAHGFAINPLKYASGLAQAVVAAGAQVHSHATVHSIKSAPGGFRLHVGGFQVRARHVIVGVNGYGADDWVPGLDHRVMPVMSSVMVTRPLTGAELQGPGWASDQAAYDTRARVHYFRLLPDGRFLMGTRGGSSLNPVLLRRLDTQIRKDFETLFPHWAHVEAEYKWNGLLALAWSKSLYVGPLGDWQNAWTAAAYHGNGVAMGSYAGRLLADLAVGAIRQADLPAIMRGPLRRFPLPRLKMAYIKGYYIGWDIAEWLRG